MLPVLFFSDHFYCFYFKIIVLSSFFFILWLKWWRDSNPPAVINRWTPRHGGRSHLYVWAGAISWMQGVNPFTDNLWPAPSKLVYEITTKTRWLASVVSKQSFIDWNLFVFCFNFFPYCLVFPVLTLYIWLFIYLFIYPHIYLLVYYFSIYSLTIYLFTLFFFVIQLLIYVYVCTYLFFSPFWTSTRIWVMHQSIHPFLRSIIISLS